MRLISFYFLLIMTGFTSRGFSADWIQQTIDYTINNQFDSAEAVIEERFAAGDSGLSVYFYYASILNSKMTHYENGKDLKRFNEILDEIIGTATYNINNHASYPDSERAVWYFYRGSAYGYQAYAAGKNGQWFKALDKGLASIDDLEKSVQIDTALYDAYLGIGVYNYWRSTKLKYMLWLPFVPDKRQEGVEQIKLAVKKGKYSAAPGMHQLIYILLDYGKFEEAVPYAEKVIAMYPESQFMRWAHAHVYYKRHKYDKAVRSYLKLLEMLENDEKANVSHWLFCHVKLAEIYYRQNEHEKAVNHARTALEFNLDRPLREDERDKLNLAAEILGDSQKALQDMSTNDQ